MSLCVFSDVAAALAAEEALFEHVAAGHAEAAHLMWRGSRALVAPRALSGRSGFAKAAALSEAHGWPVLLRCSGGDIVPQGPGTLNLAIVWSMPDTPSIADGYAKICNPIRAVLGGRCGAVDGSFCDGNFNVVFGQRKVAGTAQRRRIGHNGATTLAHALILVNEDIAAGVAATNRFLSNLGSKASVRDDAHVNAFEVIGEPDLSPAGLANRLAAAMVVREETSGINRCRAASFGGMS